MAPMLGSWDGVPTTNTGHSPKSILYVDAYDSFSYNVVAMLEEALGVQVTVITIDSPWPEGDMYEFLRYFEAIVLGPGPGNPNLPKDVGIMRDIWNLQDTDLLPVFGICLGFQSLCLHHGIPVERLPYPLHGRVQRISTSSKDVFEHLPELEVTLYHSLYARAKGSSSDDLEFLAWLSLDISSGADTHIPMAVRHCQKPFWGVQFHPESCKSERNACRRLLQNWWRMALAFNKFVGRGGTGKSPNTIIGPHVESSSLPDIAHKMLEWSSSTTAISAHRSLPRGNLDTEIISEVFNQPNTPAVTFQSNGRFGIVSIPSPDSWRLEYIVELQKLTLRQVHSMELSEAHVSVTQLWDALRHLMEMKRVNSGNPEVPFWGGLLGYFSYELGLSCLPHFKESTQSSNDSSSSSVRNPPDVSLLWCERSIVLDNTTGHVFLQSTRESDNLTGGWLDEALELLQSRCGEIKESSSADSELLESILRQGVAKFPDEATYKQQIEACKAELEAGESYELCLSCETTISLPVPTIEADRAVFPWKLYRRLKKYNPATFSGFANLGDTKIVSSSPECFLNWDRDSTLEMKPMKGTVRKSPDMTLAKAKAILGSTKEMAENLMIADLIRHDLYGVCGSGGVYVEKLLEVEDHGRVYSMITHVKGKVRPHCPGFAVRHMPQLRSSNMAVHGLTTLQRCLPPGSMTGAPKERSCEHLKSIEQRKRGIYSGVMGYLDLGGGGSFSVMIRMAFTSSSKAKIDKDGQQLWRIGAGGAITTLSTAEGEWQEMLTKLRTVGTIFAPFEASEEPAR
ncbi:hypothetical protein N7492_003518 [Penicillium capsulatum]|uniref:aminodeoxychorismate synthase n=1 Tax=Penicillium capsulatum TaxID=69766 RepID=A0A9W9LWA6_9EURO|nr:hypothetical protein N7492_003518 [Penicillium capsulatum]KAJ6121898.1 hypothetical protein N7512_004363 [Penicillium capsulatum]